MDPDMLPRTSISLALLAMAAPLASAQSVFLAETNLRDTCFNNELTMRLKGTVTVQQNGQPTAMPRSAEATHSYFERILEIKDGHADKAARFYNRAEATLVDGTEKYNIALKANHTFLIAHRLKDQLVVYHPAEALTREEMEITSHFDSLAAPGLLPRREVKVGETWPVPAAVVQAITDLDAVEKADVTGKLEKVEGDFAYLSFRGLVQGIDMAAPVTVMVKDSMAAFNLKLKRLVQVDWRVIDQRQQGPVSPGLSADVAFQLKRVPMDAPAQLNELALAKVPPGMPPAHLTNITYRNLNKGFEFQFSRDWHLVSQTNDGKLVLRLVDGSGEFIAQCSVTPWQKIDGKNLMTLADFSKLMRESKGWQQKDGPVLDETDKIKAASGYNILRVTAEGKLAGVDAVRSIYLVATPAGDQIFIDFTMLPAQASKLDGRDVALVQSVQFLTTTENRVEATPASQKK
jgi:hypothetical protein